MFTKQSYQYFLLKKPQTNILKLRDVTWCHCTYHQRVHCTAEYSKLLIFQGSTASPLLFFFLHTHTHTFGSDFLESFPPRCTKYKITQSSLLAKLSLIYLSLEISCKQQKEKNTNHFHFAMKHLQSWTNIPHQIHPTHGIFLPGISMYTCLSVRLSILKSSLAM